MSSSAKRALRILEFVGQADHPLGVTEIARALSLAPGTVFRGIDALQRADLVSRYQSSSRYVLGHNAERLRQSVFARFRIRELALPYLHQLASVSGDTASLHVRLGWYSVRIASAPGAAEVTNAPALGDTAPLGENYGGQAILAFLPETEMARYRAWAGKQGLPWSEKTESELRSVKKQRFALGEPALGDGRMPVAFPIQARGAGVAAITIDGPALEPPPHENTHAIWDWLEIVTHFEYIGHVQPQLFDSPFAHLDPDTIAFEPA